MAHRIADRVMETSTTTGTGTVTLGGAVLGFRTFASVPNMAAGDEVDYTIEAVDANGVPTGEWEVTDGVYSANTLTRGRFQSSSTGSRVSFSAGTKRVYLTLTAEDHTRTSNLGAWHTIAQRNFLS